MSTVPASPSAIPQEDSVKSNPLRITLAPFQLLNGTFTKNLNDIPGRLADDAVRERCFEVLGLFDEYHRLPRTHDALMVTETNVQAAYAAPDLDEYILAGRQGKKTNASVNAVSAAKGTAELAAVHRSLLTGRIRQLLRHPQVRGLLLAETEKEQKRFRNVLPVLRRLRDVQLASIRALSDMYSTYLASKREHKVLVETAAQRIKHLSGVLAQAGDEEEKIARAADPVQKGFAVAQEFLTYKRQMETKGFALTKSRRDLLQRITEHVMSGKKVFLVGSTGTGKTELAFYVANEVTGGFELIPWHEGTTMKDVMGQMQIRRAPDGTVVSGFNPGPLPRAMTAGTAAIHEEFTGGATRTMLGMKPYMNAKPGQIVRIPEMNGEALPLDAKFFEIFTGNPKDERTTEREELDPAILRMLKGVKVQYMPARELTDIVLAQLMDSSGLLRLSLSEVQLIKICAEAAEMMQQCHDNALTEDAAKALKDACGVEDLRLIKNFLDPGTFFSLFSRFDYERSKGTSFPNYLAKQLQEFLLDPKSDGAPEEQKLLLAILQLKGVLTRASTRENVEIDFKAKSGEKQYLLPSQFAAIHNTGVDLIDDDPLAPGAPEPGAIKKLEDDILGMLRGASGSIAGTVAATRGALNAIVSGAGTADPQAVQPTKNLTQGELIRLRQGLEEAKMVMGPGHYFGPESLMDAFGIALRPGSIPLPPPKPVLECHKRMGHTLRLRWNLTQDGLSMTMENMIRLCERKFEEKGFGKLIKNEGLLRGRGFYNAQAPKAGWVFTTDAILPNSDNRNYLRQTEMIVSYLKRLYAGVLPLPEFEEMMKEWNDNQLRIDRLLRGPSPQKATPELAMLSVTKLRHSLPEAIFDFIQTLCATGGAKRFLEREHTWTSQDDATGRFLIFGETGNASGSSIQGLSSTEEVTNVGVTLSIAYPNPFA